MDFYNFHHHLKKLRRMVCIYLNEEEYITSFILIFTAIGFCKRSVRINRKCRRKQTKNIKIITGKHWSLNFLLEAN